MTFRDRTTVIVAAAVVALGGFWFLAIKPKRAEIHSLGGRIAAQDRRLQEARATAAAGVAAKAAYARNYAIVAELGKAVPADDDLPTLVYQLDAASHGAHVDFEAMARATETGSGAAGAGAAGAAGAPAAAGAAGTAGAAGAAGATGASSSPGVSATGAAALPPGATVGTAGFATLPFSFTFSGSFFQLQRFIGDVQGFVRSSDAGVAARGRLLTIDGVSIVPGSQGLSKLEAKVAATAYLIPPAAPAAPSAPNSGAGASSGSGASAAAPSNTSSAIVSEANR